MTHEKTYFFSVSFVLFRAVNRAVCLRCGFRYRAWAIMEAHLDPSACAAFFSPWQSCAKELWSRDRILHSRDSRDKEQKGKPGDKHNFFCSLLDIIENDVKPSLILFYDMFLLSIKR